MLCLDMLHYYYLRAKRWYELCMEMDNYFILCSQILLHYDCYCSENCFYSVAGMRVQEMSKQAVIKSYNL